MSDAAVIRDLTARIARALEALEAGDLPYATRILENGEHELRQPDFRRPHRCPHCGNRFRWPGELEHHLHFGGCWKRRGKAASA